MPDEEASPKGLWWKSLVLAWVLTRLFGVVFLVADVEPADWLGVPILAVAWAVTWTVWRRRARAAPSTSSFLHAMQRTTSAFAATVVFALPLVVVLDDGRTDIPATPVTAAVAAVAVASVIAGRRWVPRLPPPGADTGLLVEQLRLRHFAQLGWSMLPMLVALGGTALLRDGRVYAIGAAASVIGFALAWPTRNRLRPDVAEAVDTVAMGSPP